jgi:hypothetical protein
VRTLALVLIFAVAAPAVELRNETLRAFGTYVRAAEASFDARRTQGRILWSQGRPEIDAAALRSGKMFVEKLTACDRSQPIEVPYGMVHDWIGVVFVPGAKLDDVLRVVEDYNSHKNTYRPEIIDSKLMSRDGDRIISYMRILKKKVITVVLDTNHDATYTRLSPTRAVSRSRSISIREVENHGKSNEYQLPIGNDHGFLWRLYSFWSYEEKDGGVYVECEAVTLTRDIPLGLHHLVRPFIESLPRESLSHTLEATRRAALRQPPPDAMSGDCTVVTPAGGKVTGCE